MLCWRFQALYNIGSHLLLYHFTEARNRWIKR